MADHRVAAAVAELYGADPDAFTERRKALVVAAREAGDKQSAAAITALRKPTRAAWVVNRLARADPDAPARLAAMAAELRDAERAKDGPRLRELSVARGALIDALTAQALAAAGTPDPPPSLRAEVTDTLTAALGDPETAAAFAAGSLTKAAQWSGFGYADFPPADDAAPARPAASDGGDSAAVDVAPVGTAPVDIAPVDIATRRSRRARTATASGSGAREQERLRAAAEEEQRRAQEAAERADRAREKYEDAERTLAQASTAAAEATGVEDRLEAEVRQLEERLTQARDELATARLRARRAEAAERRAQQVADRLK